MHESIDLGTMVATSDTAPHAIFLVESIKACGGRWAEAGINILLPFTGEESIENTPTESLSAGTRDSVGDRMALLRNAPAVRTCPFPLREEGPWPHFPFRDKVHAAAEAERISAASGSQMLLWLDVDSFFLRAPTSAGGTEEGSLMESFLPNGAMFAARPVDKCLIGSRADDPVDGFWAGLYAHFGLAPDDVPAFRTVLDRISVRSYWNAGFLAVRPEAGLLRAWAENFEILSKRGPILTQCRTSARHALFLHQAVLAVTVLSRTKASQRRLLDARYAQPLHLREESSPRVPTRDAISCRYDTFFHDPDVLVPDLPETLAKLLDVNRISLDLPWHYDMTP